MRRVGVLNGLAESDPRKARIKLFEQGLQELGWSVGSNLHIDYRWASGDSGRAAAYAKELVDLAPDVLFATSPPTLRALLQATRLIPIVFIGVADPVGLGFVKSLAKPGGNITGFTNFEYSIAGKWLELLKQISPRSIHVAVISNPTNPTAAGYLRVIDAAAPTFALRVTVIVEHNAPEIERGIIAARETSDSLIVLPEITTITHRELVLTLAAQQRLPTIYPFRFFAEDGGLISYGPELRGEYRKAGIYVGRILKGEKPADLPVQAPTNYELVINLKTAKALGLTIPPTLLARADEVIE
jgi:putative ABC transport system substrate-binding protein